MSEPNGRPNIASNQLSRRQILKSANTGFGYLALASLLRETAPRMASASQDPTGHRPLAPKPPQFPVKAKRIIFLFMEGAASQMDTWDYKPKLQEDDGKVGPGGGTLTASKFKLAHGYSGPSPSGDSAAHGRCSSPTDATVDGGMVDVWTWDGKSGLAGLCHD